jgi:hypothetical protein
VVNVLAALQARSLAGVIEELPPSGGGGLLQVVEQIARRFETVSERGP